MVSFTSASPDFGNESKGCAYTIVIACHFLTKRLAAGAASLEPMPTTPYQLAICYIVAERR
jgi:hypothetical protein